MLNLPKISGMVPQVVLGNEALIFALKGSVTPHLAFRDTARSGPSRDSNGVRRKQHRHETTLFWGQEFEFLKARMRIAASCAGHGCSVGQLVLPCHTVCHVNLVQQADADPVQKNGFVGHIEIFYAHRWNQHLEKIQIC